MTEEQRLQKIKAGRKGGFIKWSRISKKKRSEIMRKVAKARYEKLSKVNSV